MSTQIDCQVCGQVSFVEGKAEPCPVCNRDARMEFREPTVPSLPAEVTGCNERDDLPDIMDARSREMRKTVDGIRLAPLFKSEYYLFFPPKMKLWTWSVLDDASNFNANEEVEE